MYYTYVLIDPRKPITGLTINNINIPFEPFYVGKGTGRRVLVHFNITDKVNKWKQNKINKIKKNYATDECYIKVYTELSESDSFEKEAYLIKELRKDYELTNLTDGGEGISGFKHSEKTKKIISEKTKGKNNPRYGCEISDEQRSKTSATQKKRLANSGNHPNGMKGKKHSSKWKADHSNKMKQYYKLNDPHNKNKKYEETYGIDKANRLKDKQSSFMKENNPMNDPKNRKKISEKLKGKNNPMCKYKYIISFDDKTIETYSLIEFALEHGLNKNGLFAACKNERLYKGKYFIQKENL